MAWVELRRNIMQNPRGLGAAAVGAGGGAVVVSRPLTGGPLPEAPEWLRGDFPVTPPTTSPNSVSLSLGGTSADPCEPLTTYTVLTHMISSYVGWASWRLDAVFWDAGGVGVGSAPTGVGYPPPAADTWLRLDRTVTTPAGAAFMRLSMNFSGGTGMPAGGYLGVGLTVAEKGGLPHRPFDGGTPATRFVRYSWLGAPGASASIAEVSSEASLADLEYDWLGRQGASGTLADRRRQIYTPNPFDYWASKSALTPNPAWSLTDHKMSFFRAFTGKSGGSLADLSREFFAIG